MSPVRPFPWWPTNVLYGAGTAVRRRLYGSGLLRTSHLSVPVISVGNISAGGTGKTPLVQWLVERLFAEGFKICVVSRGYGRPDPGKQVLASDGRSVLAGADRAGDEPALLAESLIGQAAVLCNVDRFAGAAWAVENLGSDLIILDDAFQHFQLDRTLDLVVVDASRPFDGLMREGVRALRRADAILLSRAELASDLPKLHDLVSRASGGRPTFSAWLETTDLRPLAGSTKGTEIPAGARVSAFCGVGNPDSFFAQVKREPFELVYSSKFLDHKSYTQNDVNIVDRGAREAGANYLITTAKDEVKLRSLQFELPVFVLVTTLFVDRAEDFLDLIKQILSTAVHTGSYGKADR
ncbi:MAG: tetraacyldisaccharide 4'-kinase [Pyrinomonadaceae bacterium]